MVVFPETKLRHSKKRGVFVEVTAVMWIAVVIKIQVTQRFPPDMNKFPRKKSLPRESSERGWPCLPHPASICDEVSFRIQVRLRCASASDTLRRTGHGTDESARHQMVKSSADSIRHDLKHH